MNNLLDCTSGLLQSNYRERGQQALNTRQQALQQLLSQRQMPPTGWNDLYIQSLLGEIALMDSNNFVDTVGVGEREGRVFSSLVRNRHMSLSHGMGRSGDLLAQQPKAAGSSLLLTITHALALHAIKLAGLTEAKQVLLLPVATGMSIVLALSSIKQNHPKHLQEQKDALQHARSTLHSSVPSVSTAASSPVAPSSAPPRYVIWSRIDQKTCLKSIFAADLVPIVIELKREGDQLITDLDAIQATIERLGPHTILAVMSTTSCFAPRAPDRVVEIAQLCGRYGIAHVINNAYGLQSASTCALINSAVRKRGRVDAVIASMDKNFMVPVGGAVVIGFQSPAKAAGKSHGPPKQAPPPAGAEASSAAAVVSSAATPVAPVVASSASAIAATPNVLNLITALYPGRASSSAISDLFITLLSMGADGWLRLLSTREALVLKLKAQLTQLAEQLGERLLTTDNDISFAMTLDRLGRDDTASGLVDPATPVSEHAASVASSGARSKFTPSYLGSLLFSRNVSGPRVLSPASSSATINGITFQRYGTHSDSYPHAYITAACSIGMEEREIEAFVARLDKCIKLFRAQKSKSETK